MTPPTKKSEVPLDNQNESNMGLSQFPVEDRTKFKDMTIYFKGTVIIFNLKKKTKIILLINAIMSLS